MTLFELAAVVITLIGVWLTVRQVIWCWPFGIVGVTMYALVFHDARLYANMGLQVIYFSLSVYGWWAWLHGGKDHGKLEVSLGSWRLRAWLLVIGGALAVVLGLTLYRFTDASVPFLDSALTSFSLVAQWMLTRKLLENWIIWITVDVFYVGMFVSQRLYLTAGLYFAFLLMASMGFVEWRRSMPPPFKTSIEEVAT